MGVPRSCAAAALAALTLAAGAGAQSGSTISGIVTTNAAAPPALKVTTDVPICGASLPDESLVVGEGGAVANAVVVVEGLKAASGAAAGFSRKEVTLTNAGCRFVPHVVVAAPGATVRLTSKDPALHTVHAQQKAKSLFNVGLPIPGITLTRTLPASGVVKLGCNTHSWMSGYAYITTDRAMATGADGRFSLENVPPGTYTVRVWHEALKEQRITVSAGTTDLKVTLN